MTKNDRPASAGNTTDSLESVLLGTDAASLSAFYRREKARLADSDRPFAAYMRRTVAEKGLTQQAVFLAADIPEGYGYKLISQEKHTSQRDVILRLCLGGRFSLTETQKALRLYGFSPLYARIPRDAALIVAFNRAVYEPADVDALLAAYGFSPLYACREP